MSYLQFNQDNTVLSCPCGRNAVSTSIWNALTEHAQQAIRQIVRHCPTCRQNQKGIRK